MTALAIFTGEKGKDMPNCHTYSFLGTSLVYKYNTCCITDYIDEELMSSNNPFAFVVLAAKTALLMEKIPEVELMERKLLIARLLYKKGIFTQKKIANVLTFLNNYIVFEDPEINSNFKQQFDQITGKTNTMGIMEQVAEMRVEEAKEAFVKKLLTRTEHSLEEIASLADVSLSVVERIKERLHQQ